MKTNILSIFADDQKKETSGSTVVLIFKWSRNTFYGRTLIEEWCQL